MLRGACWRHSLSKRPVTPRAVGNPTTRQATAENFHSHTLALFLLIAGACAGRAMVPCSTNRLDGKTPSIVPGSAGSAGRASARLRHTPRRAAARISAALGAGGAEAAALRRSLLTLHFPREYEAGPIR